MKRITRSLTVLGLLLAPFAGMRPQSFVVGRDSRVTLLGRSNINSWRCSTSQFTVQVSIDSTTHAVRLVASVPVASMECGHARMNADLRRALKADSFPEIRYELTSYRVDTRAGADSFEIRSAGSITVAGHTQRVEIPVHALREQGGMVSGEGGARILMTDFGIKPPTAFFGAIRAKNALEVRIDVEVKEPEFVSTRAMGVVRQR
jgi:polyisoprenoid-binding protein YceI